MDSSGAFTTGTSPALGGASHSRALAVLATAAVVGLLWAGKVLFVTLFFALFLSFALHPFVELLEKIRLPRSLAAFVVLFFNWNIPLGLLVFALAYAAEVLLDNSTSRAKWQLVLRSTWIVTLLFVGGNILALFLIK